MIFVRIFKSIFHLSLYGWPTFPSPMSTYLSFYQIDHDFFRISESVTSWMINFSYPQHLPRYPLLQLCMISTKNLDNSPIQLTMTWNMSKKRRRERPINSSPFLLHYTNIQRIHSHDEAFSIWKWFFSLFWGKTFFSGILTISFIEKSDTLFQIHIGHIR